MSEGESQCKLSRLILSKLFFPTSDYRFKLSFHFCLDRSRENLLHKLFLDQEWKLIFYNVRAWRKRTGIVADNEILLIVN